MECVCLCLCLCVIEGKEITTANIFTGHTMLLSHCEVFKREILDRLPSYYRTSLLNHKNTSIQQWSTRTRSRTSMRGHVTGSFAGGSHERYQGVVYTIHFLRSIDLAKTKSKLSYELFELFVTEYYLITDGIFHTR